MPASRPALSASSRGISQVSPAVARAVVPGCKLSSAAASFVKPNSMDARSHFAHRATRAPRGRADSATTASAEAAPVPPPKTTFLKAFYKFVRPHTIRGTILGTSALVTRSVMLNSELVNWALLPRALLGLVALLCGNGYIVGINQIYDVEIDEVNKPFLPVAAKELSPAMAWVLCVGMAGLGMFLTATNFSPMITALYAFGLFLGTIYSIPPLRLKRFAIPAFMIIATVRGFLLNFGVYNATSAALGVATFAWTPPIAFITIFVTVFAVVIAITKDLPDMAGDRKFNIETFATRLGERNLSYVGSGLLLCNYIGASVAAFTLPGAFNVVLMGYGHLVLGACLVYQTYLLQKAKYSQGAIRGYYQFIWYLFYTEYALLPFI
mmetsp:Transcript_9916/g.32152  ORF Transcript_9916/g.32152 Transcript_9916/m.32152 type:complete len:381 (-) Transcript_9916:92-1234(-)